jgi:hypothetical protein
VDFSIFKTTEINELVKLQLRVEIFDIFSLPNFASPLLPITTRAELRGEVVQKVIKGKRLDARQNAEKSRYEFHAENYRLMV